jgi:membrane-associated phospholipid phosphatase
MPTVGPDAKAGERSRRRAASHPQRSAHQVPSSLDGREPGALHRAVSRPRRASDRLTAPRVSGVAAVLVLALYALFVGTPAGRELDAFVVRNDLEGWPDRVAEHLTAVINPATLALAVLAIIWVAYRSRRLGDGVRAALLIPAAAALAQGLEAALGGLDPLRGESERQLLGNWFYPSGHAAVAMALALAALLLAPARSRPAVALWGGVWVSVFGYLTFAEGSHHHPSDVVGGFLVALALASIAVVGRPERDQDATAPHGWPTTRVAMVLAAIAAASLTLLPAWLLSVPLGPVQPPLLLAGSVVSAAAFLIVSTYERVLDRPREQSDRPLLPRRQR